MSFNNLSNYTGLAGGGLELSSQIAGLGSETGQVADGDTLLEGLAKINDRLPLSGGTLTGDLVPYAAGYGLKSPTRNYGFSFFDGFPTVKDGSTHTTGFTDGLTVGSAKGVGFSSTTTGHSAYRDTVWYRVSAGVIGQRNGTNAQEHQIYGTYTDASNYERLALRTAAGDYTIAAEAAGTGTQRNLVLSGANRAAHIADVSSGTDAAYETAINAIIAALESHGIAATS
jgi:hypothetical protein